MYICIYAAGSILILFRNYAVTFMLQIELNKINSPSHYLLTLKSDKSISWKVLASAFMKVSELKTNNNCTRETRSVALMVKKFPSVSGWVWKMWLAIVKTECRNRYLYASIQTEHKLDWSVSVSNSSRLRVWVCVVSVSVYMYCMRYVGGEQVFCN